MSRVLHIFNAIMPSGAETMWRAAAGLLTARGVETHVLATASGIGSYAEAMRAVGFVVYHLPYAAGFRYAYDLYKFVRAGKYDAVLVHPEPRKFTYAVVCRLAGARVVCVHHSVFKWGGKSRLKRCAVVAALHMLGCRFVGVSESVSQNERRFGHRPGVIWNWIDASRFDCRPRQRGAIRTRLGLLAEDKVLLTVGNCSPIKNHEFLFHMMKHLPAQYKLLHVGLENEALCSERRLASDLGSRVIFLGARMDLEDLFAASDLFAMSSMFEGLGIACLEALYCGLPTVVSDVEGLRDIAKRVPGCHLSALEEHSFARKVEEVIALGRPHAEECHNAVLSLFSMERSVYSYLKLLGVG